MSILCIMILTTVVAEMREGTSVSYRLAINHRDRLRAEYLARSGINLTRLLVAAEPQIRQMATPFYQSLLGRPPPQIPIWTYANDVLRPFWDAQSEAHFETTGIDFSAAEGLGDVGGDAFMLSFAENSKLNLNEPLHLAGDQARLNVAQQVFAMTGGYQTPSPFDPLFERRDPDGLITTRLDLVSALIDWWDFDTQRTVFDPGANTVNSSAGAEDDAYSRFREPYSVRNAPMDSLEELRLIRGMSDDIWATFVEPDPEEPRARSVTIYGSGKVNPNEARAEVLLARTCSILVDSTLCTDPAEAAKFITVLNLARQLAPIPWFSRVQNYVNFLQGRGGPMELYPMLQGLAGDLIFTPVTVSSAQADQFHRTLVFGAAILSVHATGRIGRFVDCDEDAWADAAADDDSQRRLPCTRVRIRSVLNFDTRWTPPPPNAGAMPRMGIIHHWRVD